MTDSSAVFPRLQSVVRHTFRLPADAPIAPSTMSADVDGWDSLSHSILIMSIEDEFGIMLDNKRAYAVNDVGELADLIEATLAAQNVVPGESR